MPATVIDSLVLELGLDPRKFTEGQRDALGALRKFQELAIAGGKQIESQGEKTAQFFSTLKRQVLEIGALFLGGRGAKEFLSYITNLDAATGRTAKTLDITAQELSAWQGAARQTGGSVETITGSLQGLSGEMQNLVLTGQASFLPLFNRLGISVFNSNHQLKTSAEILLELAKAMEGVDPARARALLSMVPGMNEQTINLLLKGRAAVEGYLDAARKAGVTTKEAAEQAEEYQKQLALVDQAATDLGRTLFNWVAPSITKVMTDFRQLIDDIKKGNVIGKDSLLGRFLSSHSTTGVTPGGTAEDMLGAAVTPNAAAAASATAPTPAAPAAPTPLPRSRPPEALRTKAGAFSGGESQAVLALAEAIQREVPDLDRFTAGNDAYHAGTNSKHAQGLALDFTLKNAAQSAAVAESIRAKLRAMGVGARVIDEYKNPSGRSTGGHIHVQFDDPAAAQRYYGAAGGNSGAPAAAAAGTGGSNSTSQTLTVGSVNIYSQAQDGDGVARDFVPALRRYASAVPFNTGQA
jgi:hypothetical protein